MTEEKQILELAQVHIIRTLQATISVLGFPPDDTEVQLKAICRGDDLIAIMALGAYLDVCREKNSYERLVEGLAEIKRGQERMAARQGATAHDPG